MQKYKKLANNSLIFTIGTFGSKIISFFMLPLYTYILNTTEYGTVDLVFTTISLFIPLLTLELGQASLRFAMEAKIENEKNDIFSTITIYGIMISVMLLTLIPIIKWLNIFDGYEYLFVLLLVANIFNNLYSQFIRGIGLVKEFAINGILMTFITVISNVWLLVILDYKVEGYLISLLIAISVSTIYLFVCLNGQNRIKRLNFNRKLYREMLSFSIPIIPNSAMWWIINGSTRYFILFFIGSSGNGLYAIANKIPTLISIFTGIFSQAWQLSSFEEYNSKDKDEFYTEIFLTYSTVLFLASSSIILVLKPIVKILVDESFFMSWQIVPMLLFAVIYQSLSSFLGMNYTAAKETKGAFSTSVYGGGISILTSFILIPFFGLIGAGLSSALSFGVMYIMRFYDTKKYVIININKKIFVLNNIILVFQTFILFIIDGLELFTVQLILFLTMTLVNKDFVVKVTKVILSLLKNIFNRMT